MKIQLAQLLSTSEMNPQQDVETLYKSTSTVSFTVGLYSKAIDQKVYDRTWKQISAKRVGELKNSYTAIFQDTILSSFSDHELTLMHNEHTEKGSIQSEPYRSRLSQNEEAAKGMFDEAKGAIKQALTADISLVNESLTGGELFKIELSLRLVKSENLPVALKSRFINLRGETKGAVSESTESQWKALSSYYITNLENTHYNIIYDKVLGQFTAPELCQMLTDHQNRGTIAHARDRFTQLYEAQKGAFDEAIRSVGAALAKQAANSGEK